MGSVYFFCHKTMENLGSDPNAPPVLPPGITAEAWLHTLTEYAKKMKNHLPHLKHPTDEYLTEGAQLFFQDGDPSAGGTSSSPPDAPQAAAKFHCADLFDLETQILDLADHVRQILIR